MAEVRFDPQKLTQLIKARKDVRQMEESARQRGLTPDKASRSIALVSTAKQIVEKNRADEAQQKTEEKQNELEKTQEELSREKERAEEREGQLKIAQKEAATDHLTGLYNKRAFEDIGKKTLETAIRTRQPLTLLYLDLDDLKSVNTRYGHPVGDVLIRTVGELIETLIRKADVAARIGGDELAILLTGTPLTHGSTVAEKIRNAYQTRLLGLMSNYMPEREKPLTVSIGCSGYLPDTEKTFEQLTKEADDALYLSKGPVNGNGKNKVTIFSEDWVSVPHESRITEPESK